MVVRRLILLIGFVSFGIRSAVRPLWIASILSLSLVFHMHWRPFHVPRDNLVEGLSLALLAVNEAISVMNGVKESESLEQVGLFLFIVNSLLVIYALGEIAQIIGRKASSLVRSKGRKDYTQPLIDSTT